MSRHSASCSLRALRVPCEHLGSPREPLEYLEYTVSTTWLRPPQESARGVRVRAARKHGTKIVLPSFVAASIQARAPHEYSSTRRCVEWEAWDQRTATAVRCGPSNERARACARACVCARARVGTCMHTTARAGEYVRACVYARHAHGVLTGHIVLTGYSRRTHIELMGYSRYSRFLRCAGGRRCGLCCAPSANQGHQATGAPLWVLKGYSR